jgi:hypothetical protein
MKRINIAGIVLLTAGIAIGIALTMISMHAVGVAGPGAQTAATSQHRLIAEKSPPGAVDAQTPQQEAQEEQVEQPGSEATEPAKAPADWLKPAEVAGPNGAPSAVPAAPKYQSSHTEYYIYSTDPNSMASGSPMDMTQTVSGYAIPIGSGPKAVDYPQSGPLPYTLGANGLLQNPCVDPPSSKGRAYRH